MKRFSGIDVDNRTPEVMEAIEKGIPFYVDHTFMTPYMLVYGTLRLFGHYWQYFLQNTSNHIATLKMDGFQKGTSIQCKYTGNEDDYTIMDLFKIEDEYLKEVNAGIDSLESGYQCVAVPLTLEDGSVVLGKFWQIDRDYSSTAHDYSVQCGSFDRVNKDAWKEAYPASYAFYHPEENEVQEDVTDIEFEEAEK